MILYQAVFVALAVVPSTQAGASANSGFEAIVSFYQDLLQQAPQPFRSDEYAEFHLPGLRLAIFTPRPDHQPEFTATSSGSFSLCLEVATLEPVIDRLIQLGYPPSAVMTASHGREVYAYDPAGNRLIVHEGNASSG